MFYWVCVLATGSSIAVNIRVHVSFWMMIFSGFRFMCGKSISRLSFLESFLFFFWDGEAVLSSDCRQCPFPLTMQGGSLFSQLSPTFIICRRVRMAILTGGIWFLVVVLVGIPPVIFRDMDQLVLWPFGFVFFFFLFLKGVCEEIFPVASCFLKVGYVQDWFLQYPHQDLPGGSGH